MTAPGGSVIIGRDAELGTIAERLTAAVNGSGSIVILTGPAGIGKTRLLEAATREAAVAGFRTTSAANYEHVRAPLGALVDALLPLRAIVPQFEPATAMERDALGRLLGHVEDGRSTEQRRLFVIIADALARAAAAAPLMLTLDDMQWSDPETLDFLSFVAPRLQAMRLVIAVAMRMDGAGVALDGVLKLERFPCTFELAVGPLDDESARMVVAARLPRRHGLSQSALDDICRRADGNPLFLSELLRNAVERPRSSAAPRSLAVSVQARLKKLSPGERKTIEAGATLGRTFTVDTLAAVTRSERPAVIEAMRSACDEGILAEAVDAAETFTFTHELVRTAIYERMLALERVQIHSHIASLLEDGTIEQGASAALLAHHLLGAKQPSRAGAYAEKAGDEASAKHAFASARDHYCLALETCADNGTTARVHEKLARCYDALGDAKSAALHYAWVRDRHHGSGEVARAAHFDVAFARAAYRAGQTHDVVTAYRRVLDTTSDDGLKFMAHVGLAMYHAHRWETGIAGDHVRLADATTGTRDVAASIDLETTRGLIAVQTGTPLWHEAMSKAVELAEESGDARHVSLTHLNLAITAREHGRLAEAALNADEAIRVADANGLTFLSCVARCEKVFASRLAGELQVAYHALLEAAALHVDALLGRMFVASVGLPLLADVDKMEAIPSLLDPALIDEAYAAGEPPRFAFLAAAHVYAHAVAESPFDRSFVIKRALSMLTSSAFATGALLTFAIFGDPDDIARIQVILGDPPASGPARAEHFAAQAVVARVHGDRSELRRKATLVLDAAERGGMPMLAGLALELLGRTEDANAVYRRIGAQGRLRYVNRARSERLTAREAQIARLAANGSSNRAIADQLVISERTVEHHVASILAKLGVRSRAQLADLYATADTAAHPDRPTSRR